jgi:plastocyanin
MRIIDNTRLALAAAALSLAVAGATLPAFAAPKPQTVQIKNFAFVPAALSVPAGTTVTWINADEDPHNVTAVDKSFHSSAMDTDDRYSFTFSKPGDYAYFCSLHPHMMAKITVTP